MKRVQTLISCLLCFCIILSLAGCTNGGNGNDIAPGTEGTVTDGSGAVLVIPADREGLTIASVYAVAVPFIAALDLSDQVVAVNVRSRFWTDHIAGLAAAGTVGRGRVDLEGLAALAPDILIHRANDPLTVEAVTGQVGVPVMQILVESYDDIMHTLTMMGEFFGREERALEVMAYISQRFIMIDEIVAGIPEEERVTALMMGGTLGRIAGGDMLQSWMIRRAGGICVAAATGNNHHWLDIGMETIFDWDPDILFLTSSAVLDYTVDSILRDPTLHVLTSVGNGSVYLMPARIDSWDIPGISFTIGTMYMLHRMYPDHFSAEQLQAEIDYYYMFMFGQTFDSDFLGFTLGN